MTTTARTLVRYDVITNSPVTRYRDIPFPRLVALRDRDGVLSGIEVVVWWGGYEGRATISGKHTRTSLYGEVPEAVLEADVAALMVVIRVATRANTEYADNNTKTVDYSAVRNDVAAALGVESNPGIPTTREEAAQWLVAEGYGAIFDLTCAFDLA